MKGLILAAGHGTRLRPLQRPKVLLPVGNRSMLDHHLELMASMGITEVHVVVNRFEDEIRREAERVKPDGVRLGWIRQEAPEGIARAVGLADSFDEPFVVFLGDVFVAMSDLSAITTSLQRGADAVLASVVESDPDRVRQNFSVETETGGNRVVRVVEKPTNPSTDLKGCGIYGFSPAVFDAVADIAPSAIRGEYELTDAIQLMIDRGLTVVADRSVRWDCNLTREDDLISCNLRWLDDRDLDRLVHESARLGRDVIVERSVVGAGVEVGDGARIAGSVVLDGSKVAAAADVGDCVVADDDQVA